MSANPRDISTALPTGALVHRVGKLRAGIKVERMKDNKPISYPSAVDYFVVKEDQSTSAAAAASFLERYGPEPRELDIMLPGETPADCLEGAWRLYGTGGLLKRKCSGRGPEGNCVTRDDAGDWVACPCVCESEGLPLEVMNRRGDAMVKSPLHCQERWTLSVVLPDVTGLGVWQFDTGSHMAGDGMAAMLQLLYGFTGNLTRLECKLRLVPRQVAPDGKVKTVHIAVLESDATPRQYLAAGIAHGPKLALPPSNLDEAPDDLLDHEQIEPGDVEVTNGGPLDDEAVTPRFLPEGQLGDALAALTDEQRVELFAECGVPMVDGKVDPPMKLNALRDKLWIKWADLGLPDDQQGEPVPLALLFAIHAKREEARRRDSAESFEHEIHTGKPLDAGDQAVIA